VPELNTFLAFTGIVLAVLLVPGPAVLFVVTRGVSLGVKGGVVSAAGVALGNAVWAMAAALGVAAVVAASGRWFSILKIAGGLYLIWLGIQRFRARDRLESTDVERGASLRRVFGQGVVVAVLNPKTALFFVALLPPFITPGNGPVWIQGLILGLWFSTVGLITDSSYATFAGGVGRPVLMRTIGSRAGNRVVGTTYIGLGAAALVSGSRSGD
jgi:threonine/homoserine/homoserine lactone efflux protein